MALLVPPPRKTQHKRRVTKISNHKGGVGKTFILLLMAARLAELGYSVLLVDLDPQGNLSRRLGYTEKELETMVSMAEVIQYATPAALRQAIVPCRWDVEYAERIHLAPARIELENRVPESGVPGAWMRLAEALTIEAEEDGAPPPVAEQYDFVLIDTAPTLGHLLALAAACADDAIIAMVPEVDSVRGAERLYEWVNNPRNRRALNMTCKISGIVLNAFRSGVADHDDLRTQAEKAYGDLLWGNGVPLRAGIGTTQNLAVSPLTTKGDAGPLVRLAAKDAVQRYLDTEVAAA